MAMDSSQKVALQHTLSNTHQIQHVGYSLVEHFLKCRTTEPLRLKSLPHKPQQNCL